ncbi:hypothetical protein GCM10027517_08390 [Phycicoccus ginsengisoli]
MPTPAGVQVALRDSSPGLGNAQRPPGTTLRVLGGLEVAQGLAYLVVPHRLLGLVTGRRPGAREVTVTRVLGGRLVLQGLVLALAPTASLPLVGRSTAAVDGVHGLSMVALAATAPRHRRAALASAGSALLSALATYTLVPRPDPRRQP